MTKSEEAQGLLDDIQAGKWVYGFHEEIERWLLETEEKCFRLNNLSPTRREERMRLCREIFGEVGEGLVLHSPFHCDFGKRIRIGRNLIANYGLTILDEALVTIGDNVFIGPHCSIYTVNHALNAGQRNQGIMRGAPVTICNNVWLGGNVVILPGVTIGEGAVVGAGSVVNCDIPAGMIAAGNPAKVLREVRESDRVVL